MWGGTQPARRQEWPSHFRAARVGVLGRVSFPPGQESQAGTAQADPEDTFLKAGPAARDADPDARQRPRAAGSRAAALDDVLIMRLAGLQHEVPPVTVAKAARPYGLSLSS
jgi:hypothetical protein